MLDFLSLDNIDKVASILGNLGIFVITAYGFWLYHFSKKVKITSFNQSCSKFFGDSLNCTIFNKTMSPKTICDISIVFDNKYLMFIKKFEEPMLLEPFHAYNILGDKYSKSIDIPFGPDVYFRLGTPEKTIFVPFRGKIKKYNKLDTIGTVSYKFDEVVISDQVKYVLLYWYKGNKNIHKIYITKHGMMNENLKDFNLVPEDVLSSPDKMVQFFKEKFDDENWCFQINEIGRW